MDFQRINDPIHTQSSNPDLCYAAIISWLTGVRQINTNVFSCGSTYYLYKAVLNFVSLGEIPNCRHSNESQIEQETVQ